MKKALLTLALTGIITLSYSGVANALDLNITKPTVTVNTKKEESALSKKMQEWEKAQADAKAKQDANKKAWEKAKADSKAQQEANKKAAKQRQEQRKEAFDNFKKSLTTTK